MWWVLFALIGVSQAAVSADEPTTEETVEQLADPAMAAAQLAALSEPRRREVRCAMLASAVMYDVGRGVSKNDYGLSDAKAEVLAGRLAEAIMQETGMGAAEVKAVYKQDFEAYTFATLGGGQNRKTAQKTLDVAMKGCAPLYDSIDVSGGGDGVVSGLTPVVRVSGIAMPDAARCHVILSHVSIGIPAFKDEAKELAAMKARLKVRLAESVGGDAVEAALRAAEGAFSPEEFDALPEEEAEPQIARCFALAAE